MLVILTVNDWIVVGRFSILKFKIKLSITAIFVEELSLNMISYAFTFVVWSINFMFSIVETVFGANSNLIVTGKLVLFGHEKELLNKMNSGKI